MKLENSKVNRRLSTFIDSFGNPKLIQIEVANRTVIRSEQVFNKQRPSSEALRQMGRLQDVRLNSKIRHK